MINAHVGDDLLSMRVLQRNVQRMQPMFGVDMTTIAEGLFNKMLVSFQANGTFRRADGKECHARQILCFNQDRHAATFEAIINDGNSKDEPGPIKF